jgi:hypothetical protein
VSAVLKLAAGLALVLGAVVERGGYVPAPGFALISGALVALYLWFLAKVRPYLRPKA